MTRLGFIAALLLCASAAGAEEPAKASADYAATVVGAPKETPLAGDALDRRTEEVSRELRCPVCQGSSVGDSPSSTARHMKEQVREMLGAGYSEEQVLSYFEASYGEFVRLAPKAEGLNTLVWILPALLFALGIVAAAVWLRRRPRRAGPDAESPVKPPAPSDDPDLEPWLNQVRNMVGSRNGTTGDAR